MSSSLDRHLDWVRKTNDDYSSELHKRQRSADLRRNWEEDGYPGFGEIVVGLIIFFTLVAIMSAHH
ncbi:hypothetical protein J4573_45750 [Actinomadura barringtoniae]|uniref:Uncharacterized protein n=1 Tax=Actinomadura barringtoniae TaxID=1427535 RepID=A0A939T634_9ACTN|nr:hypothetical protein [Actinomadura barringtoniae]MBO2454461.1 hypothetical protein [Actinomadura barringtoniae]